MQVRVYATLRMITGGPTVTLERGPGDTYRALLEELVARWPAMQKELFTKDGELSTGIHVFLHGRDIRYLGGLDSVIPEDAEIRIFPPVGGGR
jgi:molybdopterin synthase sulfur carrier subunit